MCDHLAKCLLLSREVLGMFIGMEMHANTGLREIHGDKANHERKGCHYLEIDERLCAHTTHLLQIAVPGNANNKRGEDQRRNNALDESYEYGAEGTKRHCDIRPHPSDKQPDGHADENHLRECEPLEHHVPFMNVMRPDTA